MSTPRYLWRQLTPKQREEVIAWRKANARPCPSPPHGPNYGHLHFLVSATCYERAHHIGFSPQRMDGLSATLLDVFQQHAAWTVAWCVLPKHYHARDQAWGFDLRSGLTRQSAFGPKRRLLPPHPVG